MVKRKPSRSIAAFTHDEASRKNIPTAEYQAVMEKADQSPVQVAYQRRNRDLDPQLVWRGKDAQDWSDLVVQAPPLFIQEKVHPKVLIDDLRRQTKDGRRGSARPSPTSCLRTTRSSRRTHGERDGPKKSALARLTGEEQKAVKTTAFDLQMNPAHPGLKLHQIDGAKDKDFWSVRVSRDIRLIVHRTASSFLLCYVDHHDAAYQWAERRRMERHPTTGAAQLVEIRETVREIQVPRYVEVDVPATGQRAVAGGPRAPGVAIFGDASDDFSRVRSALAEQRKLTEPGMFARLAAKTAEAAHPAFDFCVVDEAQDVGVAELRFLAALGGAGRTACSLQGIWDNESSRRRSHGGPSASTYGGDPIRCGSTIERRIRCSEFLDDLRAGE